MKAYVYRQYGGPEVLRLEEVPTPTPGPGEVLVKILATTVNSGDWRMRSLDVPKGLGLIARLAIGFSGPRQPILGTELAGIVHAVGPGVTRFAPGDAVFAFPGGNGRCHAQFRVVPENGPIALKPDNLSFEEAATLCFGGSTALHFLRAAKANAGGSLLVIGASGAVGAALVQLGKHLGMHVTGVASGANHPLVATLGADRMIDYKIENALAGPVTYDVIADTVGNTHFGDCVDRLKPGGVFIPIAGGGGDMLSGLTSLFRRDGKRVLAGPAAEKPEYVHELAALAAAGAFKPVVDHVFEFSQMADAHRRVETHRKRGSVVVRVDHADTALA